MFGSGDIFGWRAPVGQSVLAAVASLGILAVAYRLGSDLALFAAVTPLIVYFMLSRTYLIALVFVCFSYFRLHEAYPALAAARVIAITGAAMIFGLLWRGFRLEAPGRARIRELRVLSLAFSIGAVIFGVAMSASGASYAQPNGLALGTLTILCFCAAMACWRELLRRGTEEGWPRAMNFFTAFFIFASVTVPFAYNPAAAFSHFIQVWWKVGVVVYSIAWFAQSVRDFDLTLKLVMLSGILIAGVAIYNKFMGIDLIEGTRVTIGLTLFLPENPIMPPDPTKNYASALGDPNELALVLLFPLGFAGALLFYRGGKFLTAMAVVTIITTMLAIIYTESRGGLLGLLAVGGMIGLKVVKSRALLIAGGAVAALALFVATGVGDRATAISESGGLDNSSLGRLYAWLAATHMMLDNPLTGVGMFNFPRAHVETYGIMLTGFNKAVHSTWFGVMAESGLVGLALFVGMFATSIIAARWSLQRLEEMGQDRRLVACALGLIAALAGFGVSGAFLTHGFTWPFYILVALTIALWRLVRRIEIDRAREGGDADGYTPWGPPGKTRPRRRGNSSSHEGAFA